MTIKYFGREVDYMNKNKRLNVYFPNGTIYAGTSYALKRMKFKQVKELFILLFTPYNYINKRFLNK